LFKYEGLEVSWDGGCSVRVSDQDFTVAVDPNSDSPDFEAALVLLTSEDSQHLDLKKLKQVCGRGTCVVAPASLEGENIPCQDVEFVGPGEILDIYGVKIESLGTESSLSYRFEMRKGSFFVSGESGLSEEVIEFENTVDVAFMKVSGVEIEDVVRAAVRLKPGIAVPYHYNGELELNLENLKADLEDRNISCRILEN
jgi:L-ascorbate metabolism protein UlaG (beta-lactamase superfamily)